MITDQFDLNEPIDSIQAGVQIKCMTRTIFFSTEECFQLYAALSKVITDDKKKEQKKK